LSQFKKYHPSGKLKFNNLGISQSLKLRILVEKFFLISLNLNFTLNTLGCYGSITKAALVSHQWFASRAEQQRSEAWGTVLNSVLLPDGCMHTLLPLSSRWQSLLRLCIFNLRNVKKIDPKGKTQEA